LKIFTTADLCDALHAPKQLVGTLVWSQDRGTGGRADGLRIRAPLEIDGIVGGGFSFEARCNSARPDELLSLNLLVEVSPKPRCFARLDWKAKIHGNSDKICGDAYFQRPTERTHFHDTELHRHINISDLFGKDWDLPIARSLQQEPSNFHEVMEVATNLLHVNNLREVPEPPWQLRSSFL
jgi:hypothetical protein